MVRDAVPKPSIRYVTQTKPTSVGRSAEGSNLLTSQTSISATRGKFGWRKFSRDINLVHMKFHFESHTSQNNEHVVVKLSVASNNQKVVATLGPRQAAKCYMYLG